MGAVLPGVHQFEIPPGQPTGGGIQVPPIKQVIETEHRELRELRTQDGLLMNKNCGPLLIGY